jgi:hypothetical protein
MTIGKSYKQTFSTEMFRVVKVIDWSPQAVYKTSDLSDRAIEVGGFYNSDLVKVKVSPQIHFKMDTTTRSGRRGHIMEHLISWKWHDSSCDGWRR